jgi:predicted alpha/beta-fold hydrolase
VTDLPAFVARAPGWGADLQTLRNTLRPLADLRRWPGRRVEVARPDGDVLLATRHDAPGDTLAVLVHGVTGSEDSAYVLETARVLLGAGTPVLRLNMRGAGPSRWTCRGFYHAGRSDDLRAVLDAMPDGRVALVGYSLGGNVVLKLLGEGGHPKVRAAVAVSPPVDLAAASRRLRAPRNWLYQAHLVRGLKRDALPVTTSAAERRAVKAARSVYGFDDVFIAPRHGFAGADDYYARCSSGPLLGHVDTPALVLHAKDDPWIPADALDGVDNPYLRVVVAPGGGHVGFHHRAGGTWHDACALRFLGGLAAEPRPRG